MNNQYDFLFKEGLKSNDLSKIRKTSKGDLHNHCGLGMRFSTFNKWAGGNVTPPPNKMEGLLGLDNYIFGETIKFITKGSDIEFLIEATIKEAIEDGVKILEPSIDCNDLRYFKNYNDFFNSILKIKTKYANSIDFRPEIGMPKSITTEGLENFLIPCIDSGVFKSLDLYGDESIDDFEKFKPYYKYAKEKGLKLKVHCGEFHGAENVKKAIEILNIDEIQHGIGAYSDEYVLSLIKERNIRLNICPSSNFILGAIDDIKKHPSRILFDSGITLSRNTDDLLLFNSGVSEEYLYLYKSGVFNEDELNEIRHMSLL